jgi:spore coat protein U-like protein
MRLRPSQTVPGAIRVPLSLRLRGTPNVPVKPSVAALRASASAAAALLIGAMACPADAATATGNATIQATLIGVCSLVSTPSLDFGNLGSAGSLSSDVDASGSFDVACTSGQAFTIYLGDGGNRASAGSGLRNMANGAARLPYQLYKATDRSAVWDETGMGAGVTGGSGGVGGTGIGTNQTFIIYGRIASGTALPATVGAYSDTVLVTVAY